MTEGIGRGQARRQEPRGRMQGSQVRGQVTRPRGGGGGVSVKGITISRHM